MNQWREKFGLGEMGQVGLVVRDIDRTVKYYSEGLGIGPFRIVEDRFISDVTFRGRPSPFRMKQAWTKMGPIELELIQVLSGESIHTEFLSKKGEGLHHLGFFVADLEKELAKARNQNIEIIQSGRFEGGGFAYLDTENIGGVIFELVQRKNSPWL